MLGHRLLILGLVVAQTLPAIAQQPSTARTTPTASVTATQSAPVQNVLPGTQRAAFGDIEGRAVDSENTPLARRTVRLRDVRNGKIIDTKMTDDRGVFTFRGVDPGNYVVELVNANKVVAASDLVIVNPGDTAATIVKLPTSVRSLTELVGHHTAAAAIVAATAATAGVLAVSIKNCVSPPCAP